jgi:DNA-binding XRE family transcriptional regulator
MTIETFVTASGEKRISMTVEEFEDLTDALRGVEISNEIKAGRLALFSESELDDYLAAPTPLHFYRRYRGVKQSDLAAAVGISAAYLSQLENGDRTEPGIAVLAKLAAALKVRIEDLLPVEVAD